MIPFDCELPAKGAAIILQAGILTGLGDEYLGVVSTIESEWKIRTTDIDSSILRLIRFADIKKNNTRSQTATSTAAFFTTKLSKLGSNRAPPGTCTFPDCIKKNLTPHYHDRCFLKYLKLRTELRAKYSLQQMKLKRSKGNLRKDQPSSNPENATPVRESWQQKVFATKRPQEASWLIDDAADVHVYNDRSLMREYHKKLAKIGGSTSDRIFQGRGTVRLRLSLVDRNEGVILDLKNVFFFPSSPSNLVSLGLFNDHGIFYGNENETLYDKESKATLAYTQRWRNSFFFQLLNFTDSAVNLTHIDNNTDKWPTQAYRTAVTKPSLTVWHKRLRHLNFPGLKQYLKRLDISYSDDSAGQVCDSCQCSMTT